MRLVHGIRLLFSYPKARESFKAIQKIVIKITTTVAVKLVLHRPICVAMPLRHKSVTCVDLQSH